jgi:hypothetical protein
MGTWTRAYMLGDISNVTREYRPFVQTCLLVLQLVKGEKKRFARFESRRIEVFVKGGIDKFQVPKFICS